MNPAALDRFRCPTCGRPLDLHRFDGAEGEAQRVAEGALSCGACRVWYPIASYVPVLLDFETRLHRWFADRRAVELKELAGYGLPRGTPRPGEISVQETFTDEWDTVHGDELSFSYTEEDLERLNRQVWLRWLDRDGHRGDVQTVLEVGCGLGSETLVLHEVIGPRELYAIDLNFALLRRGKELGELPGVNIAVASVFALPFAPGTFDLGYSQGVIHHTYSTRAALEALTTRIRPGGYCFIWVYGLDDHLVPSGFTGVRQRVGRLFEQIVRPLVSRAPKRLRDAFFNAMSALLHPLARADTLHSERWQRRNTDHQLRDWLSPRFAHRHSYNELLEWYESLGLDVVDVQSPLAFRRLFNRRLWGVGLTGRLAGTESAGDGSR